MKDQHNGDRRRFLQVMALGITGGINGLISPKFTYAGTGKLITKPIPSSNEQIPVIGLGSSRTFNVGDDPIGLDNVTEVMRPKRLRMF